MAYTRALGGPYNYRWSSRSSHAKPGYYVRSVCSLAQQCEPRGAAARARSCGVTYSRHGRCARESWGCGEGARWDAEPVGRSCWYATFVHATPIGTPAVMVLTKKSIKKVYKKHARCRCIVMVSCTPQESACARVVNVALADSLQLEPRAPARCQLAPSMELGYKQSVTYAHSPQGDLSACVHWMQHTAPREIYQHV